jgi:hypothetical protein
MDVPAALPLLWLTPPTFVSVDVELAKLDGVPEGAPLSARTFSSLVAVACVLSSSG